MDIYAFLGISIQNFDNFQFFVALAARFRRCRGRQCADRARDLPCFRHSRPHILGRNGVDTQAVGVPVAFIEKTIYFFALACYTEAYAKAITLLFIPLYIIMRHRSAANDRGNGT